MSGLLTSESKAKGPLTLISPLTAKPEGAGVGAPLGAGDGAAVGAG